MTLRPLVPVRLRRMSAVARLCLQALVSVLLALSGSPLLAAPKTDVVVLRNGDRLTGEVDQLERGKLTFKTDDEGTLEIEWDKIASVSAGARFDVDDLEGQRYVGSLGPGDSAGQMRVTSGDASVDVRLADVIRVRRIRSTLWQRLDGSLDAGASYTSASELFTLDVAGTVGTERPGYEVGIDGSSTLTTQPGVEDTRRSILTLGYRRRFPHRWLALASGQLEQNRELGFDLRSSAGAGGGRYLVLRPRDRLLAGAGLSLNHEKPVEGEGNTNVELVAMLAYDRFSYDFPKVDLSLAAMGYASLSDSGRWRLELDARLKRELVRNFYASLRGYESYDSRPATAAAAQNDYGATFSLGLSF
jgi:hypothetical protein